MKAKQRGFNLMELMIVVAIASVLLALAVPSFQATIRSNRLSAQINEFIYTLKFARTESIKRGLPVTVCRSTNQTACTPGGGNGWEGGWIGFVEVAGGTTGTLDTASGETIFISQRPLTGGSTLRGNNNVVNLVTYNSQGMVSAGTGTFTLCDKRGGTGAAADAPQVIVAFSGQTRLQTADSRKRASPVIADPTCP